MVVGVNVQREENETPMPILTVDPTIEGEQIARLRAFRASRDAARAAAGLEALRRDAREDRNVMPAMVEAVGGRLDPRRDRHCPQGRSTANTVPATDAAPAEEGLKFHNLNRLHVWKSACRLFHGPALSAHALGHCTLNY